MSKTKHTQGELKSNPLTNPTKPDYYCLYTKEGDHKTIEHIVTVTSSGLTNKDEVHGNAARLVKCWNMHDELIETLKLIMNEKYDGRYLYQIEQLINQSEQS